MERSRTLATSRFGSSVIEAPGFKEVGLAFSPCSGGRTDGLRPVGFRGMAWQGRSQAPESALGIGVEGGLSMPASPT